MCVVLLMCVLVDCVCECMMDDFDDFVFGFEIGMMMINGVMVMMMMICDVI